MDVLQKLFYVPIILHLISENEQAFLHCTSSAMLQIVGLYRVKMPPSPPPQRNISAVSSHWANSNWNSDSLSNSRQRRCEGAGFLLICPENAVNCVAYLHCLA